MIPETSILSLAIGLRPLRSDRNVAISTNCSKDSPSSRTSVRSERNVLGRVRAVNILKKLQNYALRIATSIQNMAKQYNKYTNLLHG